MNPLALFLFLFLFLFLSCTPSGGRVWIEAESGAEYSPLIARADPDASQRIYISSFQETTAPPRSLDNGLLTFSIELPSQGRWRLWARTRSSEAELSPFDISIDGSGAVDDAAQWTA
jgi:hypothetical protein